MQFQFYIPYKFSAYSEEVSLEWTVMQLKTKVVEHMVSRRRMITLCRSQWRRAGAEG